MQVKIDKSQKRVRIYTLAHPETGLVFYVGRTTLALHQRLSCHSYKGPAEKWNESLANMIRLIRERGLKPVIEEVDSACYADRKTVEEYWIQQFAAWGFTLCNVKHYEIRNFVPHVKLSRITIEELGLFNRLYFPGDYEEIASKCDASREIIRTYCRRTRMPKWAKDAIKDFYTKRAKEVSDWYLRETQSTNELRVAI